MNGVFLDNGTLKVRFCTRRSTFTLAANHTALRFEPQDSLEDQLRDSDTRSVRRASGFVLVGKAEVEEKSEHLVKDNVAFRKQKAAEYGIGFELPNSVSIIPNVPKNTANTKTNKAA